MNAPYSADRDVDVLPSYIPVPGFGVLPANAYLLRARQPVLIDTGLVADRGIFLDTLRSLIRPDQLRWLWLTHVDPDHVGNLVPVLKAAPSIRIVTNFIGAGKINLITPVPMDRFFLLRPGQTLDVGDRRLTALRPPCYDAPETFGLHDDHTGVLFSADCFGAILEEPASDAGALAPERLAQSQRLWATVDAPWLQVVNRQAFEQHLEELLDFQPRMVLSSHLPPATGLLDRFADTLLSGVGSPPFVGPDQQAIETARQASATTAPAPAI